MYLEVQGNTLILTTGGGGNWGPKRSPNIVARLTEDPPEHFHEVAVSRDARGNYYCSFVSDDAEQGNQDSEYKPRKKQKKLKQGLPELEALKGTLAQSGQALLMVLQTRDVLFEELETLYVYASMRRDEDTTNSVYLGMFDRAMQLLVRASTAISYVEPEILALPQVTLDTFVQETSGLSLYRQQLDDINRNRPHVRTAEVEAVLAAAGEISEVPDSVFSMIDNADLKLPQIQNEKGEEVQLTKGNYLVYIRNTDRRVRTDAFEVMHGTFLKQRNTIAATLAGQVKGNIFFTRQRGFGSSRERALARNNIPVSVYDNPVETVSEHIHLLNRYMKLRKRLLQLDRSEERRV